MAIFSRVMSDPWLSSFDLFGFFAVNLLDDFILFLFLETLLQKKKEI